MILKIMSRFIHLFSLFRSRWRLFLFILQPIWRSAIGTSLLFTFTAMFFLFSGYPDPAMGLTAIQSEQATDRSADLLADPLTDPTVTDVEGNVYKTVQIGDQVWMAENLRAGRYKDASPIPNVTGDSDWAAQSGGAWANYNHDVGYGEAYGRLYNGYAVIDSRGLCPEGWHVPTDADWTELSDFLGGESAAGGKMKATGSGLWLSPDSSATNESGFDALPGGSRGGDGVFAGNGSIAAFWSSSESQAVNPFLMWQRELRADGSDLVRSEQDKRFGLSVRCVMDPDARMLSLADLLAGPSGVAEVDVRLTGLEPTEGFASYQFNVPLQDGVELDSVSTYLTLSADAGGEATSFVSSTYGRTLLSVAFASQGYLTAGDKPMIRLHLRIDPSIESLLKPEEVYVDVAKVRIAKTGSITRLGYGDLDGNGKVLAYDAAALLHLLVGGNLINKVDPLPWVAARLDAADVDGDGFCAVAGDGASQVNPDQVVFANVVGRKSAQWGYLGCGAWLLEVVLEAYSKKKPHHPCSGPPSLCAQFAV